MSRPLKWNIAWFKNNNNNNSCLVMSCLPIVFPSQQVTIQFSIITMTVQSIVVQDGSCFKFCIFKLALNVIFFHSISYNAYPGARSYFKRSSGVEAGYIQERSSAHRGAPDLYFSFLRMSGFSSCVLGVWVCFSPLIFLSSGGDWLLHEFSM